MAIKRSMIRHKMFREIFAKEDHHDHEIILDDSGMYRWKECPKIRKLVDENDLNQIIIALLHQGYTKNSEMYRRLYRDLGYSLNGYWGIFYWSVNNEDCDEYRNPKNI